MMKRCDSVPILGLLLALSGSATAAYDPGMGSPRPATSPTSVIDSVELPVNPGIPSASLQDVPPEYWAVGYIEALLDEGYVAGCSEEPPLFCPEKGLSRAEASVLVQRGRHGGGYRPVQPTAQTFSDVGLVEWYARWAEALWGEGLTAGCGVSPLAFCPVSAHTRAEAAVFFLRTQWGKDYLPPAPTMQSYSDVPLGPSAPWYSKWVYAAYDQGWIQDCEDDAQRGDRLFRPADPITRAEAACMLAKVKGLPRPRIAELLDAPIPANAKCFWMSNASLPECRAYYDDNGTPKCPGFFNPVYDDQGRFYPSACWAEALGVSNYTFGVSPRLRQFFQDLWRLPRTSGDSFRVPEPDIEFSYNGSGLGGGWKNGTFFRSSLWLDSQSFEILDFDIATVLVSMSDSLMMLTTGFPVQGPPRQTLLAHVLFDDSYPAEVLKSWSAVYAVPLNDYFARKGRFSQPFQVSIETVVFAAPAGVEITSGTHPYFTQDELDILYSSAIEQALLDDPQIFAIVPVGIGATGGYQTYFRELPMVVAPLGPGAPYSTEKLEDGLNSLAAFQQSMITLSHELLHVVGLPGDHFPMGYGTMFLDIVGQDVDPVTGKRRSEVDVCQFLATSPDFYAVELPTELSIRVGEEPAWLGHEAHPSGDCLSGLRGNEFLKDADQDGEYEIMYKNNLIGVELQRFLGWVDVDGDGIAELDDPQPYGGYGRRKPTQPPTDTPLHAFTPLGEVRHVGCRFLEVELDNGFRGLVPWECPEFNREVNNIYLGVRYRWLEIEKPYGTVLLHRRGRFIAPALQARLRSQRRPSGSCSRAVTPWGLTDSSPAPARCSERSAPGLPCGCRRT
ncbi:MAG TPA: S-layer homology domain-containing protein [Anaerolineales bacterium]|nr:S-layer homology domain-containing protein [Anaerolineales bacterium]